MKKRIFCIAMIAIMMLSMCIMASAEYAANRNSTRIATASNETFSFWIEADAESRYDPNSVYKDNTTSKAYVDCDKNDAYWPRDGVTLRVRNASHDYATEALEFSNGQAQYLKYLSGQAYKGDKFLYGSFSDAYASPGAFLRVDGEWRP